MTFMTSQNEVIVLLRGLMVLAVLISVELLISANPAIQPTVFHDPVHLQLKFSINPTTTASNPTTYTVSHE